MKAFFFTLLSISALTLSAQITFQKEITFPSSANTPFYVGNEIGVMPNGDVIMAVVNMNQSIQISRLSSSGQLITAYELFIFNGIESDPVMEVSPSGNIDVFMVSDSSWMTDGSFNWTRLDANMNVLFSKKIEANNYLFYSLYANPSIGYFPNGDIAISISSYSAMVMLRMDQNGNLLWHREFTADSNETKNPSFSPCITSDGGALIPGKRNSDNFYVKIDGSGNVQWTTLLSAGIDFYAHSKKVIQASDGGYYVVGFMYDMNNWVSYSSAFILKLNSAGNYQWIKNYALPDSTELKFWDVFQTYSGELVISGGDYLMGGGALLSIADVNGNIQRTVQVTPEANFWLTSPRIASINSADILFSYTQTDMNGINYKLFRSDWLSFLWCDVNEISLMSTMANYNPIQSSQVHEYGQYTVSVSNSSASISNLNGVSVTDFCSNTGIASIESSSLNLYPNPASSHIALDLGSTFEPGLKYQVVDLMGRKVMSGDVPTEHLRLMVDALPSGLYHLRLSSGQVLTFSRD
ncbi:MAG: T9SS type A sorting domain-containing protein [Bacteroidia bacterium]|nr:T9SS type A sorting domain-containing protein [Bacteroidia bacterium]